MFCTTPSRRCSIIRRAADLRACLARRVCSPIRTSAAGPSGRSRCAGAIILGKRVSGILYGRGALADPKQGRRRIGGAGLAQHAPASCEQPAHHRGDGSKLEHIQPQNGAPATLHRILCLNLANASNPNASLTLWTRLKNANVRLYNRARDRTTVALPRAWCSGCR